MDGDKNLKELKIWLCADLKNTNGQLVCECGGNADSESDILQELQEITQKLVNICNIISININENKKGNNNKNQNKNQNKHGGCECQTMKPK